MTTVVRVSPHASMVNQTLALPASINEVSQTASVVQRGVTFQPVPDSVINEIIGYVTLGLNKIGTRQSNTPDTIYKWHIWLKRMNEWMKENKDVYPKLMLNPTFKLPASLYFLAEISLMEIQEKTNNASTAPLGPLLPSDINTFINALKKGLSGSADESNSLLNSNDTTQQSTSYVKFVENVNKIAYYAIGPQTLAVEKAASSGMSGSGATSIYDIPTLIPPVVQHQTSFTRIIESFKDVQETTKNIPKWLWISILLVILYVYFKNSSTSSSLVMSGGSSNVGNVLYNISDFVIPGKTF